MNPYDNADALLRMLNAPRRNNFFYGKRMDVQHFQMEQDYGKSKQWLLNRLALGKGVLCGLKVTIDNGLLCVDPGFAIDGLGREIVVPVRACIDPLTNDGGCCAPCCGDSAPPSALAPAPVLTPIGVAPAPGNNIGGNVTDPRLNADTEGLGLFTLWLCYKECKTDFEPVLVSECGGRQPCAAGTIVESFCLKVTPGAAPLQQDPDWCANLWPAKGGDATSAPAMDTAVGPNVPAAPPPPSAWAALPSGGSSITPSAAEFEASLDSHRRILCELLTGGCAVAEGDSCVPLGLFVMRDQRIVFFDDCLVRPRVYSNTMLLDLILCLAEKIDDCCNGHPPPPPPAPLMRVASIDFVRRVQGKPELPVTSVVTPLQMTTVDIVKNANAIRVRFTQPFAQDAHKPVTHEPGDADFDLRNVRIIPFDPLGGIAFVPGTLTIEAADTIRFDLFPQQPYALPSGGWQKGRFRILLRGTDAANAPALANASDVDLDGEAIAPAGGAMSGDGTAGGDFEADFVVGGGAQPPVQPPAPTLRVQSVQFVNANAQLSRPLDSPLNAITLPNGLQSIRVKFTAALAVDAARTPSVADQNDPDFTTHNVQVALVNGQAPINYVPGTVVMEAADTLRFDVRRGTRVVNADGIWIRDISDCQFLLRGTPPAAGAQQPVSDTTNSALDGDPIAPAGGVVSGDGTAGGDFAFKFTVKK